MCPERLSSVWSLLAQRRRPEMFPILLFAFVTLYVAFLWFKHQKRSRLDQESSKICSTTVRRKDTAALEYGHRIKILFGSQTGTGEKFSKQLQTRLTDTYGGAVEVATADLETYCFSQKLAKEEFVFILVATYGDGDPTDSAVEFDEWLAGEAESGEQVLEVCPRPNLR